ncbi:hypothetical protein V3C99_012517, partial [Haemonchus contortus]
MKGHRTLVTVNSNRLDPDVEFARLRANTFITADFRPRQLDYMLFACTPKANAFNELRECMADLQYFPSPPPAPSGIRPTSQTHQQQVNSKLTEFRMFQSNPREVMPFLESLYGTTVGTLSACVAETLDTSSHPAIWTTPNINAYPTLATFQIPKVRKTGWTVGQQIEGAYQTDIIRARIVHITPAEEHITVTAQIHPQDTPRFRIYITRSQHCRISAGTYLHNLTEDKSNPILTLLEGTSVSRLFTPQSKAWSAARAILSGDVTLSGEPAKTRKSITAVVGGERVVLNSHQVNAINWFHKDLPLLIIDSAYGAGKSLCTTLMAVEAVKKGKTVLIAAVQNSALDVICSKLAQMDTPDMHPVRYVNEMLARDTLRTGPYDIAAIMERLPVTHSDRMGPSTAAMFRAFADKRRRLREFLFTGVEQNLMASEHKTLLFLEEANSERVKALTSKFLKIYQPNILICTIASAINLTTKKGLWRRPSRKWDTVLLDEASMIPEATLIGLFSRFPDATYTLIGDTKQLPPFVGTQKAPRAAALCSQSVLEVAKRVGNAPTCKISTVYRPHARMMELNSYIFYNNELVCGTPVDERQALLRSLRMPNKEIPIAFVDVLGKAVKSITGSQSNEIEARAAAVLVRLLLAAGIPPGDIMVICLYRDQLYLCESILSNTHVTIKTVDSAQGSEKSIVILCTTRTKVLGTNLTFFDDPKRLNVALSRARDGMFILGSVPLMESSPLWGSIIRWCRSRCVLATLEFFRDRSPPP